MEKDIGCKTAFGVNYAIIGIENQEKTDYGLPLRIARYEVNNYQKQFRAIKKLIRAKKKLQNSGEYLYGFEKSSRLHPVITFCLYAGDQPWDGATTLHGILDFTNIPDSIRQMTADYHINLIDIRRIQDTSMFKTDVKQVFDFIRFSKDKEKLYELVNNDPYYQHMEDDAVEVIANYTNSKNLFHTAEYENEGGTTNMCKAILDLMDDSKNEGLQIGRTEGRAEERIQMLSDYLQSEGATEESTKKIFHASDDDIKKAQELRLVSQGN